MTVKRSFIFAVVALVSAFGVFTVLRLNSLRGQLDAQNSRLARLEAAPNQANQPPASVQISFSNDWIGLGKADAPVTVLEFTDYECPFCRQFHQGPYLEILRQYVDSGKVRWVSRDLPLQIHAYAAKAAEAAHCAREQGKFWEFRDAMLSAEQELSRQLVRMSANRLSLDTDQLLRCVDSGKYRSRIANDIADARVLQVDGTPAFVFARTSSDILAGPLIIGSTSFEVFRTTIDSLLASARE